MGQAETTQRGEQAQAARARARVRIGNSIKDLASNGSIGCPGCSLAGAVQRERLETLAGEVADARQENKRLHLKTHDMQQRAVHDRTPSSSSGNSHTGLADAEEMFQLKQTLWQLQKDNVELKGEVAAVDALSRESTDLQANLAAQKKLAEVLAGQQAEMANFRKTRAEVEEAFAAQRSQRAVEASGVVGQSSPGKHPFAIRSVATPQRSQLPSGARRRSPSHRSSEKPSHRSSEKSSHRSSSKSATGPSHAEMEVRQKIENLQKDNNELRKKVRMLAVK